MVNSEKLGSLANYCAYMCVRACVCVCVCVCEHLYKTRKEETKELSHLLNLKKKVISS